MIRLDAPQGENEARLVGLVIYRLAERSECDMQDKFLVQSSTKENLHHSMATENSLHSHVDLSC